MLNKSLILILALCLLAGCRAAAVPDKTAADYGPAVRAFYVGLAALEVGDDERARAELARAAELAAGEAAVWNNLGVLDLRQKNPEAAAASFEKARAAAPDNTVVALNLAALDLQQGRYDAAIERLEKVVQSEPANARALYALAQEKERQTKDPEALALYQKIAETKPDNLAVRLEIARLAAKLGQSATLAAELAALKPMTASFPSEASEQFAALEAAAANPRQAATAVSFLKNTLVREPQFRAGLAAVRPSDTAPGELLTRPLKLAAPDFAPAAPDTALAFAPARSEPAQARFATAVFLNGSDAPQLLWSDGKQTRAGAASLPVAAQNAQQVRAFDFDYDFKNDLAFATAQGFRLFRQTDGGVFADVTGATRLSGEITQKPYAGVWTFDAEADGDLDLILGSESGAPVVLQNNADGTFAEVKMLAEAENLRDLVWFDIDEDGDADALTLDRNESVDFFLNERGGLYKKQVELHKSATDVSAFAVGDLDNEGRLGLIWISDSGYSSQIGHVPADTDGNGLYEPGNGMTAPKNFCTVIEPAGETRDANGAVKESFSNKIAKDCVLRVADFDNNGASDILLANRDETQIFLAAGDGKFAAEPIKVAARVEAFADANGDGRLDLFGVDQNGRPTVFENRSTKNYRWQILRPRAAKTEGDQRVNTFGIGGEAELRAGLAAQKRAIDAPQIHFGLGEAAAADVLRVVWGNGYVQAEFDLQSDQSVLAEQRLKGSCPHLFAWNGEKFAMVKDAPPWSPALGLKINAQDTYGILQTEEWFKVPGDALRPKDGFYELRITGEYWESFYLDHYRLIAVDHPAATEIFTDERFAIPLPPLKVFTTETRREFAAVRDTRGEDAAEIVKTLDERYLDDFRRGAFQGVAEDHFVEVELPADAPADRKLWLVGDGFVHPTDASINVQLGQSARPKPKSLSLETIDERGAWRTVKDNLGFPAGKMKTVLIELPAGAKKFRLRTNMEIFWDRLAWAVDLAENETREQPLDLTAAELRYRGFSVIEKRDASSPEKPIYERLLTTGQRWRDLEGFYTRFGDVRELLAATDDRMVLMNAGDELVLKFPAPAAPPEGWTRDFVLVGNGWIKDGDLNSVFSKTLLPLPTHATNDYTRPPTRLEDDPVYRKNRADWERYHTRYVTPDGFRRAVRMR